MADVKVAGDTSLKSMKRALNDTAGDALAAIGARAVELAREELRSGPRTGKLITSGSRIHRASAPGEPPASWSGELAASLTSETDRIRGEVTVTSDLPYADYLEYGTLTMAPRPFVGPVLERLKPEIDAIVARAFGGKGMEKGGGK